MEIDKLIKGNRRLPIHHTESVIWLNLKIDIANNRLLHGPNVNTFYSIFQDFKSKVNFVFMKIYHNPRCSKSRQTLDLIKQNGVEPEVIEYLKDIPSKKEFKEVLAKLNKKPSEILRKGEAVYKEKFKGANFTDEEWIEIADLSFYEISSITRLAISDDLKLAIVTD